MPRALLKAMKIKVADIETAVGEPAEEIIEAGSIHRIVVVTDEGRSRTAAGVPRLDRL